MNEQEMEKIKDEMEAINKTYRQVSSVDEHIEMIEKYEKLIWALKEF